jgi:uncharacterized protein (TIGR02186 family)
MIRPRGHIGLLAAAAALLLAGPAAAERLVTSLSNHRVLVTSNFTGVELVLFGTIERDAATVPGGYDIVATVTGPPQDLVTRRKERVLGVWVNTDSREFIGVPSFLFALSNRAPEDIAAPDTLRRLQVGLNYFLLPQRIGGDVADVVPSDPFRQAFLRIREQHGLYLEDSAGVTFLAGNLFRAGIPIPATAPTGTYTVDVKLFADGSMIARTGSAFEVTKVGFEQFVAETARTQGLFYGLATAAMAIFIGWLASVIFRRD